MIKIDYSIVFIGMTCSGKSTLANELTKVIPFRKASFGGYLFNYAQEKGIDTKKDNLQVIGQNFIDTDYKSFLENVLLFSNAEENVIFEGVRHILIQKEIERLSDKTTAFFIDTPFDLRYKRFNSRESDKITEMQFLDLDNHPVEKEIEPLKDFCDVILDGRQDVATLLAKVVSHIKFKPN